MAGAIAHDEAQRLRVVLEGVFDEWQDVAEVTGSAREAFFRLVDVLETSSKAVVLASEALVSTQEAADLLGVSRMTVVRLIDRGELAGEVSGVHRRVSASEIERYRETRATRREAALKELAQEIGDDTPPDKVIRTR